MEYQLEIKYPLSYLVCSTILHIIGCVHFTVALVLFFQCILASPNKELISAAFQHLSVWSCCIHAIYSFAALVTDALILIITLTDETKAIYGRRSFIRACLGFPSAMLSNIHFWILRDIIHSTIPTYIHHMTNTNVIIFEILDFVVCNAQYPSKVYCTCGLCSFFFVYVFCLEQIGLHERVFVYPLIGSMTFGRRVFMYLIGLVFLFLCYSVGKFFNSVLWNVHTFSTICKEKQRRSTQLESPHTSKKSSASSAASLVKIFSAHFKKSYSAPRTEFQAKQKAQKDSSMKVLKIKEAAKKSKEQNNLKRSTFLHLFK